MSEDLFQIPPSAPSALQQARARLAKAQAEVERLEEIHDNQGPEIHPQMKAANRELQSAANSVGMALETGVVIDKKKVRQAFYTPYDVAPLLASLADVEGHAVLEPSAGDGALVNACQMAGAKFVHAIEMEPTCEAALRRATDFVNIADFLAVEPERAYSRVVMNPPFTKGQDVKHIEHALKFLAKGGRLVAIVPDKDNAKLTALGAFIEEVLEAGTFKSSGTNIATRIISITT